MFRRFVVLAAALPLAAFCLIPCFAQTPAARPRARAANVVSGTLSAVDAAAATIALKNRAGATVTYRFTEKTQMWRGKRAVEIVEFKTGDSVTVRFRKSSVGPPTLYDLADTASWAWLDRLRHETTASVLMQLDDSTLQVSEGADAAQFSYRVTDRTQYARGGKPATPADFKAGDHVYVIPRLLPGGGTMAIAVSDGPGDAAKLKERSRMTVSGTIRAVHTDKRAVSLRTAAGDDRELTLLPDCVIRYSGKDVPLSYLRPGLSVTLHITRDDAGEQVVKQVTIKGKTAKKPAAGAAPKKP